MTHQFEDMTQTFRHKAQKFAEQLVTEVFAAREGSVPAEPAGEPPTLPEELKTQAATPDSAPKPPTAEEVSASIQEPQVYRDESRVSEFGESFLVLVTLGRTTVITCHKSSAAAQWFALQYTALVQQHNGY